jgi:hypothetical protein
MLIIEGQTYIPTPRILLEINIELEKNSKINNLILVSSAICPKGREVGLFQQPHQKHTLRILKVTKSKFHVET